MKNDKRKILGKVAYNDVILCTTTSTKAQEYAVNALLEAQISFTQKWKRLPLGRRITSGSREMCVILIHRAQYSKARGILEQLDRIHRRKLVVNPV